MKTHKEPPKLGRLFNQAFDKATNYYTAGARFLIKRAFLGLSICAILIAAIVLLFHITPTALVPNEDQGYLLAASNLPDGASIDRVQEVSMKWKISL